MGKRYTEKEIDEKIQICDISEIYRSDFVNYTSNLKGTKKSCSEYIMKTLLEKNIIKKFKKEIKTVTRKNSYKVKHKASSNNTSNRKEEIFAKTLINEELDVLGKILDFQVPLKNVETEKIRKGTIGKIDLISCA